MNLAVLCGIVLAFVAFLVLRSQAGPRRATTEELRQRYLRMLQLPPPAAQATAERVLADMRKQYPQRSTRWHLQRLIADLERDRR